MAGPKGEECQHCYYWGNYMNEEVSEETLCNCCIRQTDSGMFRYRNANEWCGEFKPMPEKQEGESHG